MTYRDDLDAAHARIAALEEELARLRGDLPPEPARKGVIDELTTGLEELGREIGGLVSRATAKLTTSPDAEATRLVAALSQLTPADRALIEQIATVLRTESDPAVRAAKVRALISPG
jgi:hypothetical protein